MKQEKSAARMMSGLFVLSLTVLASFASAQAQTSTFTYQGRFTDSSVAQPTNGTYNMQFALYDGSNVQQPQPTPITITNNSVAVTNGVFTVMLDFSAGAFTSGADRFLEIRVFSTATNGYVTLAPRQQLTTSPFSIRTISASAADSLSNLCVGCVDDVKIATVSGSKITGTVANASAANTATTATSFSGSLSGDVTGTQNATVVSKVSGQTAANVAIATALANGATNANTASTIVKRDASGNFSAGIITATTLKGNALTATDATQLGGVDASQYVVTTDPRLSDARTPTGSAGGSLSGTYPSPTLGTGTVHPANFATLPYAIVRQTAPQTFSNGAIVQVRFDSLQFGSGVTFDNANATLTINTAGLYEVSALIIWSPNGSGARAVDVAVAGGHEIVGSFLPAAPGVETESNISGMARLNVGDIVYLAAGQTSGGSLATSVVDTRSASLSVRWVGP